MSWLRLTCPSAIAKSCKHCWPCTPPQAQVWAYGSRVNGKAHEGSDLDLVLRNPTDLSQDVEGWDQLKDALQASDLPMLVDVHLWSRLPQAFHANIEAEYVVLQA